jgi:glucosamine--fructose-6-phosphate aminotransferase (isomerizing)
VEQVERLTAQAPQRTRGHLGIGHTRWATHGGVTAANAHPHVSSDGKIALVHNGVIENHVQIKRFLLSQGYTFVSQTDTEALCNLIAYHYAKEPEQEGMGRSYRLLESVRKSLLHVEGTYGLALLCADCPGQLVGARKSSPLIIGVGDGENMLASDASAFAGCTTDVVYLKDNEIVSLTQDDFVIINSQNQDIAPVVHSIDEQLHSIELGDFSHYMQKEIFEQPEALENAMRGRFSDDGSTALFGGLNITAQQLRSVDRIVFCACGTAWHACLVAEYLIERFARIPVEVEYASEFRYRNAPLSKDTLVFVISQSGETLDTLGALRESQRKGFRTLAITNVVGSSIAREADGGIYQHAGPEIGVASTKAFTSQLTVVALLTLYLARLRDMSFEEGAQLAQALRELPGQVRGILQQAEAIQAIARQYAAYPHMLFLARQALFPIALEGALKVKEVAYIHAEGLPAAEMKHGHIALISDQCPCVVLVPRGGVSPKTLANMQEVKARGARVLAVVAQGVELDPQLADDVLYVPDSHEALAPILFTVPLQLFAYAIAVELGRDVDKPRNLAKSVTVE